MVHEHFDGWRSGVAQAGEKLVSAACLLHTLQLGQGGIAPSSVMLFGHGDRTAASTSPHLELTALEQAGESFLHAMGASPARPRPISDATIAMAGAGGADRYPRVTDLDPRRAPDRWARGLVADVTGAPVVQALADRTDDVDPTMPYRAMRTLCRALDVEASLETTLMFFGRLADAELGRRSHESERSVEEEQERARAKLKRVCLAGE
jgi:hypothetical protein